MTDHRAETAPASAEEWAAWRAAWRALLPGGVKHLERLRLPFVDVSGRRNGMPLTDADVARLLTPPPAPEGPPTLGQIEGVVESAVVQTMIAVFKEAKAVKR